VKVKWIKKKPTEEGWYWIKYRNKRNKFSVCPAFVTLFNDGGTHVHSAYNDTWVAGPNHGGPDLKGWDHHGKWGVDRSLRFGPRIEEPND